MHMRLCILFVCLFLASISAVQRLGNFKDLRNVPYGKHFPRHGLKLLFWLSKIITSTDQNNVFQINCQPNRGDFGFHRFQNYEGTLPPLNILDYSYYSVGNINSDRYEELPTFVTGEFLNSQTPHNNMDRLVVTAMSNNPTRINRVFLTSHTYRKNSFEPADTYEIDPQIIQQIRRPDNISTTDFNRYLFDTLSQDITITENMKNTFYIALRIFQEPGLAAFLTLLEYDVLYSVRNSIISCGTLSFSGMKLSYQPRQYDESRVLRLEVRSTTNGYAKLVWENIPKELMDIYAIKVAVCDTNQNCYGERVKELSSFKDTPTALNPGLQPQLELKCNLQNCNKMAFYGPVFDEANRVIPTEIAGFDASLQLYTENGWACARLYIKKTFSDWQKLFYNSWVGFYSSNNTPNKGYNTYQYVVKFKKMNDGRGGDDYDTYQYVSNMYIAPGAQIRFLLTKKYDQTMAQTQCWEEP